MKKINILWLLVLLIACSPETTTDTAPEKKDIKITVGSHFSNVPAWVPVQKGIDDAAEMLGITVNVIGPTDFNIQTQISLLEGAIAADVDVDAIATTMPDPEAFNKL